MSVEVSSVSAPTIETTVANGVPPVDLSRLIAISMATHSRLGANCILPDDVVTKIAKTVQTEVF